jgi:hypothetical protein
MDKSDFLFLVSQQKELTRKHPKGLRNWKKTLTLMRPQPFGAKTTAGVRRFNRGVLKTRTKDRKKMRRAPSAPMTLSTPTTAAETTPTTPPATGTGTKPSLLSSDDPTARPFSPVKSYQNHMDHNSSAFAFSPHPFYDPVGRRSAPAFTLSGRPRTPASEIDDRPEYVLERGPHGTYTKRKVGFLDVAEAEKRMQPYSPAFSILGKLPDNLDPNRSATFGGSCFGMVHEDCTGTKSDGTYAGYSFGVRHHHLDKTDGSTSECNNMYDSTHAERALNNPMAKYKNVSMGIPLVNLVSKDIANFPGPASYKLKPTVNAICAGGYMMPHNSSKLFLTKPRVRPAEEELERIAVARAKELCTKPERKHKKLKKSPRRLAPLDTPEVLGSVGVEGGVG